MTPDLSPLAHVMPAPGPAGGARRRVEFIMGTAISIDVRDVAPVDAPVDPARDRAPVDETADRPPSWATDMPIDGAIDRAIDGAFAHFRDVDARFSTFKPESEVSRLARGELSPRDCSDDLREVLELCERARRATDGFFDAYRFRLGRTFDPSGLVKGWSVEGAGRILDAAGARNYCINAGGDIVTRGGSATGRGWRVGIRHPREAGRVALVVELADLAVATSGAYERGEHVLDPHTGRPPRGVLSVTIVGPSLTLADVYATAVFAMGAGGIRWAATAIPDYPVCVITDEDRVVTTPSFDALLAAS